MGSDRIIENYYISKEAPEALKTYGIPFVFHFFGGAESVGSSRIIEKHLDSSSFVCYFFGGAEGVRSSRIIENTYISIHFHYFFGGGEVWEAPESLGTQIFLYIFITSLVERRAWETP